MYLQVQNRNADIEIFTDGMVGCFRHKQEVRCKIKLFLSYIFKYNNVYYRCLQLILQGWIPLGLFYFFSLISSYWF